MKLVYRAVKYQKSDSILETISTSESGTYRGVNWKKTSPSLGKVSQVSSRLKYRGVDYLA